MNIVGEVPIFIHHRGVGAVEMSFIRSNRVDILLQRFLEPSDDIIGVRRHMDEMAKAGRQTGETFRMSHGAIGIARGFGHVNVKMDRRRVIGIARENAFDQ